MCVIHKKPSVAKPVNPHYDKDDAPATLEEKITQAKLLDKAARQAARKRRCIKNCFFRKIFRDHIPNKLDHKSKIE